MQLAWNRTIIFLIVTLSLSSTCHAADRYVALAGQDAGTCGEITSPCLSIQYAVDQASDNDRIKVATGVYHEGYVTITDKGLAIQGGWNNTFDHKSDTPSSTILDGEWQPGTYTLNGFAIVSDTALSMIVSIDNFTLQNAGDASAGGGIYASARNGTFIHLTISNTIIKENQASWGGGLYLGAWNGTSNLSAHLVGNVIADNAATTGAGIYAESKGSARVSVNLTNNTITNNTATAMDGAGGIHSRSEGYAILNLKNSIIWGNTAAGTEHDVLQVNVPGAMQMDTYADHCDIGVLTNDASNPGIYYDLGGNLSTAPRFTDPEAGNYHLSKHSPCIDQGNNAAPAIPLIDYEGDTRILDGDDDGVFIVDIGADEIPYTFPWPLFIPALVNQLPDYQRFSAKSTGWALCVQAARS